MTESLHVLFIDDYSISHYQRIVGTQLRFEHHKTMPPAGYDWSTPDLVLLDYKLADKETGLELAPHIRKALNAVGATDVFIVLLSAEDVEASAAIREGHIGLYVTKARWVDYIPVFLALARAVHARRIPAGGRVTQLLTTTWRSVVSQRLLPKLTVVGRSMLPALILGPSGSGKELVAQAVHELSSLSGQPLQAHNCAMDTGNLALSQLWGHRAGAFTDASMHHLGTFLAAACGDRLPARVAAQKKKTGDTKTSEDGEHRPKRSTHTEQDFINWLKSSAALDVTSQGGRWVVFRKGQPEPKSDARRPAALGTIFLDEVADLPLSVQAALLRYLSTYEIFPLGFTRPVVVPLRIIAATNRREDLFKAGFRSELLNRLSGFTIELEPLGKSRMEDALAIAHLVLQDQDPPRSLDASARRLLEQAICEGAFSRFARSISVEGESIPGVDGNVRSLEMALMRAAALASDATISRAVLLEALRFVVTGGPETTPGDLAALVSSITGPASSLEPLFDALLAQQEELDLGQLLPGAEQGNACFGLLIAALAVARQDRSPVIEPWKDALQTLARRAGATIARGASQGNRAGDFYGSLSNWVAPRNTNAKLMWNISGDIPEDWQRAAHAFFKKKNIYGYGNRG